MAVRRWTKAQRKEQAERMRKLAKAGKLKRKGAKRVGKKPKVQAPDAEVIPLEEAHVIFIHGEIRGRISSFAASIEIPERYLARRVGALLLGGKGR